MHLPDEAEVVIVGGGPAGSTAAFFLARAGCDVVVLDRARFPRDKPCSEYLSPQAARILQEMDVLGRLESGPMARLDGMRVTAPNGTSFTGMFRSVRGYRPWCEYGLAVRRTVLDLALLDAARRAGARVHEDVSVTDVVREGTGDGSISGVRVRQGGSQHTVRSRLVVGADGLRSVIARRAGLGKRARWPRRVAFVTHYMGVTLENDTGDMHVMGDGYVGLAPVGEGLTNVAVVVPARRAGEARGDAAGFMARELSRHPRVAARLGYARRVGEVYPTGPFAWHARRAVLPGLALVGDAADFFDPFTGEGIYSAMRGAEILCPAAFQAVRSRDPKEASVALAAYDRTRRHEFGGKRAVERIVAGVVELPWVMNLVSRGLAARPELAHTLVGVTGDFVPPREVLRAGYILRLLAAAAARRSGRHSGDGSFVVAAD